MADNGTPNFYWREGRPRWEPGPTIRARGFQGRDLKDANGLWLTRGAAIDAAETLNRAVKDGTEAPRPPRARTMSALFDALRASPKFQGKEDRSNKPRTAVEKLKIADATRAGYRQHLNLLEKWCGDVPAAALTPASIEEYYHLMAEGRGLAMANANMRVLKLAFNYAIKKLRWLDFNPVSAVEMADTDGRLVFYEPEEFGALLAAADYLGLASMGDAIVLGALTGQRKADLLALPEGDLAGDHYVIHQHKRGREAFVPFVRPLRARIEAMRARKRAAWPGVHHTLELICTRTGKPYHAGGKEFDEEFRLVRAFAAGLPWAIEDALRGYGGLPPARRNLPFTPQPQLLGKFFSDLRDTAVTWLFMAGCTVAEIANITGHSLRTAKAILDKHYFGRNEEMAASAGVKFDAFLARSKIGGA